jgi:hypothetical protein
MGWALSYLRSSKVYEMKPAELVDDMKTEFTSNRRRFAPGVLIAFIRFFRELGALGKKYQDFNAFKQDFPIQATSQRGGRANTLIVLRGVAGERSSTLSIRPFYNEIETFFRATHKRFDYPNAAPHATQSWQDYVRWLDALLQLRQKEVELVEQQTIAFVLESLPSHEVDAASLTPIRRRFSRLLQEFDMTSQRGEPRGGAFQGVVYAFIRADAPHLHLDVAKAGAGSKRLQRVGDVDGWQGERLILSAEVKHYRVDDAADVANFASQVAHRNALGLAVAESFDDEVRLQIEDLGLRTIDRETLIERVDIWDPLKQDAAVDAFSYYVCHIEKCMPLMTRVRDFLTSIDKTPAS